MTYFLDTSAFIAILDADDAWHRAADEFWKQLVNEESLLITSNYVVVEVCAVAQRRLGLEAVRTFQVDILPIIRIWWVDEPTHLAAMSALLMAGRRQLSLVDCTSFEIMRRVGVVRAFAFDRHFVEQGFECFPFDVTVHSSPRC